MTTASRVDLPDGLAKQLDDFIPGFGKWLSGATDLEVNQGLVDKLKKVSSESGSSLQYLEGMDNTGFEELIGKIKDINVDNFNLKNFTEVAGNISSSFDARKVEVATDVADADYSPDSLRKAFAGTDGNFSLTDFRAYTDDIVNGTSKADFENLSKNLNNMLEEDVFKKIKREGQILNVRTAGTELSEILKNTDVPKADKAAALKKYNDSIDTLFNTPEFYDDMAETLGMSTSAGQRLKDGKVLDVVKNGYKKMTETVADNYPTSTWGQRFVGLGVFTAVLWTISTLDMGDDLGEGFADFLKEVLEIPVDIVTKTIEVGGETFWDLIKPFLLPVGLGLGAILLIFIMMSFMKK